MHVWWRVAGISLSAGMRNRKYILFVWGDAGLWKRWIVIWWNRVYHLWNERCRMVDDQCMWWREWSKLNQQWDVMLRLNTWPNHQRTLIFICMYVCMYVCTHTHTNHYHVSQWLVGSPSDHKEKEREQKTCFCYTKFGVFFSDFSLVIYFLVVK